mgnify:CR=1 FL=1
MIWKNWEVIGYDVTYTKTGKILPDIMEFNTVEEASHFVSQYRECWVKFEVTKKMRLVCDI